MSHTLVSLWTEVRQRLEAAGVDSPVLDARMLVEAGAGVSRLDIVTDPRRPMDAAQVEAVLNLAARRETREPISHILGKKHFWTLELAVTRDVLTPRPETELLVEAALAAMPADKPTRVLDVGVGSGAILLALLKERPSATGVGLDVSSAAVDIACLNAEAHNLRERVEFVVSDWRTYAAEKFDVVVSNPPYIASGEIATLAPEVARYEPRIALDGGEDGLDAYRSLFAMLPRWLEAGGVFALEVGKGQANAVKAMAEDAGFAAPEIRHDLAGIGRVIIGQRTMD